MDPLECPALLEGEKGVHLFLIAAGSVASMFYKAYTCTC